MWPEYQDIIERAGPPEWYTSQGVPRYGPFMPGSMSVYAEYAALCLVRCQSCEEEFRVGFAYDRFMWVMGELKRTERPTGCDDFHMGDPPNHADCAGSTMTSDVVEIVEFWVKGRFCEWSRDPSIEGRDPHADEETDE